jgi:hypothetical protein
MITPVTETYIHNGHVQRAMTLCLSNRSFNARLSVIKISGTITTARIVCEIRIVR